MKRKVREIRFYSRSGKSQGVLYQVRAVQSQLNSGNFILKLPQIMLLDVFAILFLKLSVILIFADSWPENHSAQSVKLPALSQRKGRGFVFCYGGWQPLIILSRSTLETKVFDLISDFSWCCTKNGSADQPSSGSQEQRGYILLQLYCALSRVLCRRWPDG